MATSASTSFSISELFETLGGMLSKAWDELNGSISSMTRNEKGDVNQDDLFKSQAKLQVFTTTSSTASNILRGYGDAVRSIAQNIK
ncbi:MAG: hypothetical protein LBF25_00370 [Puniceicoccales bacterium]|jgi:hypothetical protein|nr:hypothetical protein [Puniceicoccales bacterium]